jgi:hypothetical protein
MQVSKNEKKRWNNKASHKNPPREIERKYRLDRIGPFGEDEQVDIYEGIHCIYGARDK